MFFLSKGIFKILYNNNVMQKAILLNKKKIFINQPLPLVQVIDIIDYEHHFVLMLFDGELQKEFIVEKNIIETMINKFDRYTKRKFPDAYKLSIGSVLQFDSFNYCYTNDLKKKFKIYLTQSNEIIINLSTLFFIGFNQKNESLIHFNSSEIDCFVYTEKNVELTANNNQNIVYRLKETVKDINGRDQFGTYNILSIKSKLNYTNWNIKAYLKKINLFTFDNCTTKNKSNLNFRLLFQDLSGLLVSVSSQH